MSEYSGIYADQYDKYSGRSPDQRPGVNFYGIDAKDFAMFLQSYDAEKLSPERLDALKYTMDRPTTGLADTFGVDVYKNWLKNMQASAQARQDYLSKLSGVFSREQTILTPREDKNKSILGSLDQPQTVI